MLWEKIKGTVTTEGTMLLYVACFIVMIDNLLLEINVI